MFRRRFGRVVGMLIPLARGQDPGDLVIRPAHEHTPVYSEGKRVIRTHSRNENETGTDLASPQAEERNDERFSLNRGEGVRVKEGTHYPWHVAGLCRLRRVGGHLTPSAGSESGS